MSYPSSAFVIVGTLAASLVGCAGGSPPGPEQSESDAGVPIDSGPGNMSGNDAGSGSGSVPKECLATEHLENEKCVPNVRACTIENGAGEQKWANGKFGSCLLKTCNAGYQQTAGVCTPSFVGKFKTPCFLEGANGLDVMYTNDFSDNVKHTLIGDVYGSNNGTCGGGLYRVVRQIGTYKRIKLSATTLGAVELDFEHPTVEITLRSALAVSDHNAAATCGKSDWVIDTPYKFPRAACTSNPLLVRTINKVDGNKLYVGNFKGPKDPATGRPQTLNLDPAQVGIRIP